MALCLLHAILGNVKQMVQIYIILFAVTSVGLVQTADLSEMIKNYETISSNTLTLRERLESIKVDINDWITKINRLNENGMSKGNDKMIKLQDRYNTLKKHFIELERQLENNEVGSNEGRVRVNTLESEIIEFYKDYDNEQRKVNQRLISFGSLLTDITSTYKRLIEVIEGSIRKLNASEEQRRMEIERVIIEALDNEDYTLAAVKLSVIYDSSVFDGLIRKLFKINIDKVLYLTTIDRDYTRQAQVFKIIYSEALKSSDNLECQLVKIMLTVEKTLMIMEMYLAPELFQSVKKMLEDLKDNLIKVMKTRHNAHHGENINVSTKDYQKYEVTSLQSGAYLNYTIVDIVTSDHVQTVCKLLTL